MNIVKLYIGNIKDSCLYLAVIASLVVVFFFILLSLLSGSDIISTLVIAGVVVGFMAFIGILADVILFRPWQKGK